MGLSLEFTSNFNKPLSASKLSAKVSKQHGSVGSGGSFGGVFGETTADSGRRFAFNAPLSSVPRRVEEEQEEQDEAEADGGVTRGTVPQQQGSNNNFLVEHTMVLQNQLALTSHMCNQLLFGQNNLIRAICDRLDTSRPVVHPQVQEHVNMLQQYQLELEAYYHQLCESYGQARAHCLYNYAIDQEIFTAKNICLLIVC